MLTLLLVCLWSACGGGGSSKRDAGDESQEDADVDPERDGGSGDDMDASAADARVAADAQVDGGLDLSCVELTLLRNYPAPPSAHLVLFTAVTCDTKSPVVKQPPEAFVLFEDDQMLSTEADKAFPESVGRRVYITLLLDMSSSTQKTLDQLVDGAKTFVAELLEKRSANIYLGIEIFDGSAANTVWQLPIRDAARLKTKLDDLRTFVGKDPSSTNLNGAVVNAVNNLQMRQKRVIETNDNGVATLGYLVLFTDGTDTSGLVPAVTAATTIASASPATRTASFEALPSVDTYAVALKGGDYNYDKIIGLFTGTATRNDADGGVPKPDPSCKDTCAFANNNRCDEVQTAGSLVLCEKGTDCTDCKGAGDAGAVNRDAGQTSDAGADAGAPAPTPAQLALAKRRVFEAENGALLAQRFSDLANNIAAQLEGTYLLAYCSPKRQGQHFLGLRFAAATDSRSTSIRVDFNANNFVAGCSGTLFKTSCKDGGKRCGGISCGACDDETETCNPTTDQCVSSCLAQNRCDGTAITNSLGYSVTCDLGAEYLQCGATCAQPRTDKANCGGCGKTCVSGSSCVDSTCQCAVAGHTACSNGCFDLSSDRSHCGSCTTGCPLTNPAGAAVTCQAGACDCGAGFTLCGNACVDTATNRSHCGGCNIACSADAACVAGQCVCNTAGLTSCQANLSGTQSCVNVQSTASNCGGCGKTCGPGSCSLGMCTCTTPNTLCNGTCTNFQTDSSNCNGCGNACPLGQICSAGACTAAPFSQCSSQTLSGSFPISYSGTTGSTLTPSQCVSSVYSTTLQFVAPRTGVYAFLANDPRFSVNVEGGSCASPAALTCSTRAELSLQAGTAVRVIVGSPTMNDPFTLSVRTLVR
jgi:hypothetical protein